MFPKLLIFRGLPCAVLLALSPSPAGASERGEDQYAKEVLPALQQFCYDCHADGVKKGKFALDEHENYPAMLADLKHWDHVRQMLVTHVMPPTGKDAPDLAQRDKVVKWIDDNVFYCDPSSPDPGHTVLRRLNRKEYDNTVRELLLVDRFRPADDFPQDDSGYGFDNIGSVLSLSPILMEKYLRAAAKLREEAMRTTVPPKVTMEIGAAKFDRKGPSVAFEDDGVLWMFSEAETTTQVYVPADGDYEISYRLAASQAGPDRAKAAFFVDGVKIGEAEVKAEFRKDKKEWDRIVLEVPLKRGMRKIRVGFINDFNDPNAPEGKRDRNLALDKVKLEGPFGLVPPRPSRFMEWLVPGMSVGLPTLDLTGEDFRSGAGDSNLDTGAIQLASAGWVGHPLFISAGGGYRLTVKLGAFQAGGEPAKFQVRLGDRVIHAGDVTAKDQAPQWFTFEADLPGGRHDLRVAFLNDYYDPKSGADRNLWIHQVKIEGPVTPETPVDSALQAATISKLGERLFRRPLQAEELQHWNALAKSVGDEGENGMGVIGTVLEAMLASPGFLFHPTPQYAGQRVGKTELIDEVTLASRLSYFLWSGPPTESLVDLAKKGKLRQQLPEVVKGMIADRRAWSLTENFAGQWLQLRNLESVYRSKRQFPEFEDGMAYAMMKETQMFFDYILRENKPVMDFITADYTFVNRRLARLYGVKDTGGLKDRDFKLVSLQGTPRAGVLTQGSILTLTSNPTRTNIVKRGKFLLESIIGIPPPPAPGNVAPLNED